MSIEEIHKPPEPNELEITGLRVRDASGDGLDIDIAHQAGTAGVALVGDAYDGDEESAEGVPFTPTGLRQLADGLQRAAEILDG